ncbi:MAG: anhydro-N-acetylmuramic acid kinase [Gammaproteobacteria bacterium]|nr:anhydro-N-acetylmuramic acid kinase [Gammaproteobacteria bacterium]
MNELYIGIMSGTSMDAIDAVILDMNETPKVTHHVTIPFPKQLHADISQLINKAQTSLFNLGSLDVALANLYTVAINELLIKANISASDIRAIGCHGQTVFHQPEGTYRFSMQLGSGSYIAEKTAITTVTDFRNRDIAAGGQGAPLVPAFHQALLSDNNEDRLIINIGGISNCTWLPKNGEVSGFDIGPGNTLMDCWIKKCRNKPYDKDGQWAATGTFSEPLLNKLLKDEYFQKSAPKSSGREYFNLDWLELNEKTLFSKFKTEDIQATLLQLTACSIVDIINQYQSPYTYFCGGGVHNIQLIKQIDQLTDSTIVDINILGINPDQVEAAAFAWLAERCINNQTGTITSVTGAKHPVISGAVYFV